MAEEPAENISGGPAGGGVDFASESGDPSTRAEAVVDALGDLFWQKAYGGQDAFECLVRTILSQNTSDVASQPAHDALMERYGGDGESAGGGDSDVDAMEGGEADAMERDDADAATGANDADLARSLADADREELAEVIRPAGLYNRKSRLLVDAAAEVVESFGGDDGFDAFVREADPAAVRRRLLDVDGVGPKTADCVLLFSGGRGGVFPVDTHVHRIARRMGLAPPDADHEGVRAALERDVPAEKCGFGHTATIQFGREYCAARKPACLDGPEACPLYDLCDRVGVDPETGEVVDPAEAAD